MVSNPFRGAAFLFRGAKLLFVPGIKRFIAIPLLINFLLFGGLVFFGINQFEHLLQWLMPELPEWLQWLVWPLWVVFGLATLVIVFYTFTIIANIISAPFNGALAEAVELHLRGQVIDKPVIAGSFLHQVGESFSQEFTKLKYMGKFALPLLLLFFIPVVNIAAPFIWLAFSAWLLALEYADYPMANHDIPFSGVKQRLHSKRVMTLGFGGATMAATMVPIVNFFVIPAAVAGATLMWLEEHATSSTQPND